jgi:hypothetical protein
MAIPFAFGQPEQPASWVFGVTENDSVMSVATNLFPAAHAQNE